MNKSPLLVFIEWWFVWSAVGTAALTYMFQNRSRDPRLQFMCRMPEGLIAIFGACLTLGYLNFFVAIAAIYSWKSGKYIDDKDWDE